MEARTLTRKELERTEAETRSGLDIQNILPKDAVLGREAKLRFANLKTETKKAQDAKDAVKEEELDKKRGELEEKYLGREARALRARRLNVEVEGLNRKINETAEMDAVKNLLAEIEEAEQAKNAEAANAKREELAAILDEQETPWIDEEELNIMLKQFIPSCFHKFLEAHCKFVYDEDAEGAKMERRGDKLVFAFGKNQLFETKENIIIRGRAAKVMKPVRLAFQIGRMLGSLLHEPPNWNKAAKSIQIEQGRDMPKWEDFVALYLADRGSAQRLSESTAKYIDKLIEDLNANEIQGIDDERIKKENKNFDTPTDLDPQTKEPGLLGKIAQFPIRLWATIKEKFPDIKAIYEEKRIWLDMAISELEHEEAQLITTRQEHVSDRDRRLYAYFMTGDFFGARGLVLADSYTSDSRWWRYHLYLSYFDSEYQKSGGEYISRDSYEFLVRCTRESHKAKRFGSKIGEYIKDIDENGKIVYKRMDREGWEDEVADEMSKGSLRMIMNITDELYDWMKGEGRFWEFDEVFGRDEVPLAYRLGWTDPLTGKVLSAAEWQERKWRFETGNMHDEKTRLSQSLTKTAFLDGKEPVEKYDGDQLCAAAFFCAVVDLRNNGGEWIKKNIRDVIAGSEHAHPIHGQVVEFMMARKQQYKEYRDAGGQPIPGYERFEKLIKRFQRQLLAGNTLAIANQGDETDKKVCKGLEPEEAKKRVEIDRAVGEESSVLFNRPAQDTAKEYQRVLADKNKKEAEFQKELEALEIPEQLRAWLYKHPDRLLDLLIYEDATAREAARDILRAEGVSVTDPSAAEQFTELSKKIEEASKSVLRQYYRNNYEKVDAYLQTYDWVENHDIVPFLQELQRGPDTLFTAVEARKDTEITEKNEEVVRKISEATRAHNLEEAIRLFTTNFSKEPGVTAEYIASLNKDNIMPAAEQASRLKIEREERGIVEQIIKEEKKKINGLLDKLKEKVSDSMPLKLEGLTDEERAQLARIIEEAEFLPSMVTPKASEAEKAEARRLIHFMRDTEEDEPIREYFILKAYNAALSMELLKMAEVEKAEKAGEKKGETAEEKKKREEDEEYERLRREQEAME